MRVIHRRVAIIQRGWESAVRRGGAIGRTDADERQGRRSRPNVQPPHWHVFVSRERHRSVTVPLILITLPSNLSPNNAISPCVASKVSTLGHSDVEGVINTPKLGGHTNIEVIIDVVLRVRVIVLSSIGR
jgi:hypothetical protein